VHDVQEQQQVGARVHLSGVRQGVAAGGLLPAVFSAIAGCGDLSWDDLCELATEQLLRGTTT
jgi:hypothetical protein